MNTSIIKLYALLALIPALLSCSSKKKQVLAPEYIFNDPSLKVITSIINKKAGTIAVIYGNSLALNTANIPNGKHLDGEKFKMVTWKIRPMPDWYGTDMNGQIVSIETVDISKKTGELMVLEYRYNPAVKHKQQVTTIDSQKRAAFIVGVPAAVFP